MNVLSKPSLVDLSLPQLAEWCKQHDFPAYRAGQVFRWVYTQRARSFDEMQNLPAAMRTKLAEEFELQALKTVAHLVAKDRTEKLLLQLSDGNHVECVLMREEKRRTMCISTQVGCAMGCVFCASGLEGLRRNLTTVEILEQILALNRLMESDEQLTNVVVMGIGEPLANLGALIPVLETLTDPQCFGLSPRRITVSTVGLPERIAEFARLGKPYNLAVSLHAPNDELRTQLVPVNDKIGIAAILKATDDFFATTGRRVTYEYVLLGGVNDEPLHARQLAALLKHRNAHVNLIPMNDVDQLSYHQPDKPRSGRFVEILREAGVAATIRKRKGADIDAACGQLRLKEEARQPQTVELKK